MSAYSNCVRLTESFEKGLIPSRENLVAAMDLEMVAEDGIAYCSPSYREYDAMTPEELHEYDRWAQETRNGSDPQDLNAYGEAEYMRDMKVFDKAMERSALNLGRTGINATNQQLEGEK